MTSTASFKCCAAVLAVCLSQHVFAEARAPKVVRDPVFGLRFEVAQERIDALPAAVGDACHELVNQRYDRLNWTFARYESGAARYYIIGGYMVYRDPVPKGETKYLSDDRGILLKMSGSTCQLIATAGEGLTDYDEPEPPQAVREGLAADLRLRLARASGGDRQLMRSLRHPPAELMRNSSALRHAFKAP